VPDPDEDTVGAFIAIEGIDGSGKSTVAERLASLVRDTGAEVVLTREPGGTEIGERIRQLLLDAHSAGMSPETEALLFAAARAQHVAEVIKPALERCAVVIIDRYVDSSLAYQWGGRGLQRDDVESIQRVAIGGVTPDLKLLLDIPVELALRRRFNEADTTNRLDKEAVQFHHRVRAAYLSLADGEERRWRVIDASRSPDQVLCEVIAAVNSSGILSETLSQP
jgi:dTMP kinase